MLVSRISRVMVYVGLTIPLILVAGCPQVRRVTFLSKSWDAGEHKTCTFLVPNHLVCDAPAPITHWDALGLTTSNSGSSAVKRSDYDASFSTRVTDYSTWDCRKTANLDTRVSCSLLHHPTAKESEDLQMMDRFELESDRAMAEINGELNAAQLKYQDSIRRCAAMPNPIDQGRCRENARETREHAINSLIAKSQDLINISKEQQRQYVSRQNGKP